MINPWQKDGYVTGKMRWSPIRIKAAKRPQKSSDLPCSMMLWWRPRAGNSRDYTSQDFNEKWEWKLDLDQFNEKDGIGYFLLPQQGKAAPKDIYTGFGVLRCFPVGIGKQEDRSRIVVNLPWAASLRWANIVGFSQSLLNLPIFFGRSLK